jgi:hypothetical protein
MDPIMDNPPAPGFKLLDLKGRLPGSQQRCAREGMTCASRDNIGGSRDTIGISFALLLVNGRARPKTDQRRGYPMANLYRLETLRGTAAVSGLQIATLIGNLSRSLEMLTIDIEHEEKQAGVRDLADPAYPVLARSLRVRRENIGVTIASLEAFDQGAPKAA